MCCFGLFLAGISPPGPGFGKTWDPSRVQRSITSSIPSSKNEGGELQMVQQIKPFELVVLSPRPPVPQIQALFGFCKLSRCVCNQAVFEQASAPQKGQANPMHTNKCKGAHPLGVPRACGMHAFELCAPAGGTPPSSAPPRGARVCF